MRNYLVSLSPYQILGLLEGEIHFRGRNHSYLSAMWADGGEAALVTSDQKWGPGSVELIEIKNGKLVRQTNLLEKAVALLAPDFQSCNSEPFNEYFPFVIVTQNDEEWTFDGAVRVCIDCTGETNPKQIPRKRSWAARLQAIWDTQEASFVQTKVSRALCGYYSEDQ
jgi:glucan biosynthesis protein